jgi:hypothetical protein
MPTVSTTNEDPIFSHRFVHDCHGRMCLVRPNAVPSQKHIADELHRRAAHAARELLGSKRFKTSVNLNMSTETIDDEFIEQEYNENASSPWLNRYSPYIGKGYLFHPLCLTLIFSPIIPPSASETLDRG